MRFENLEPIDIGFSKTWRMMLSPRPHPWPKWVDYPVQPPPPQHVTEGLRVTFINHATLLIQVAGLNIITDPQYSRACGPLGLIGPWRAHAPGVALKDLPPLDAILLSHNHYDHMDLSSLKRLLKAHDCPVYTGLGVGAYFSRALRSRVIEMDWWTRLDIKGLPLHYTPVRHFGARGLGDRFQSLWGGFYIDTPLGGVYFSGDSSYGGHFKLTREKLGAPKLAILPVGAYDPRWFMKEVHMNVDETMRAFEDLGAELGMGMHYECFRLTTEPYLEPRARLKELLDARGIPHERFRALDPGLHWQIG